MIETLFIALFALNVHFEEPPQPIPYEYGGGVQMVPPVQAPQVPWIYKLDDLGA